MRMFVPKLFRALLITIFCVTCTLALHAQQYLGIIQGDVTDATGAKVPGAVVVAEENSTHFKATVRSNGSGAFTFAALNPGTYTTSTSASERRPKPSR